MGRLFPGVNKKGDLIIMWVITVHSKDQTTMYEFETECEAREAFKNIKGCKILSEVIYFNDPCFELAAV